MLKALSFAHSLGVIHCDIKPENILMTTSTNYLSEPSIKVIDWGCSKFENDPNKETYIQSRPYRAPEVILGCKYNHKVDIWSLGCVLAELFNENLLFSNKSIPIMLAQIVAMAGPIPAWMIEQGYNAHHYIRGGYLYELQESARSIITTQRQRKPNFNDESDEEADYEEDLSFVSFYFPKPTKLEHRISSEDELFVDFLKSLLQVDPQKRINAEEALSHPWLVSN